MIDAAGCVTILCSGIIFAFYSAYAEVYGAYVISEPLLLTIADL